MAFKALTLGEIGSLQPRLEKLDMAAENISAGQLCVLIDGNVTIATAANESDQTVVVAVESKDNSGGSAGDLQILCAMPGTIVAVQTKTTLNPQDYVKVSATAGMVDEHVTATDAIDLMVGRYVSKDTGVFVRATSTPFAETLSGDEDPPGDAAVDDIVFIILKER